MMVWSARSKSWVLWPAMLAQLKLTVLHRPARAMKFDPGWSQLDRSHTPTEPSQ